jgi:DnaK suppressor protein
MTADRTTESPWTSDELSSIRDGLEAAVIRLEHELTLLDHDVATLASASVAGVLSDDLDIASQRSELLQDAVQAENTAAILHQTQHVLDRLTSGQYGICEVCSTSIARPRLEAFPRATVCIGCAPRYVA